MLEDHFGWGGGSDDNVAWYQSLAAAFKNNPYVWLEMPNEPSDRGASLGNTQIGIIQAIRGQGFNGLIGIQPCGGYDSLATSRRLSISSVRTLICSSRRTSIPTILIRTMLQAMLAMTSHPVRALVCIHP